MKKQLKVVHPYSRLMLFSLITILFVAIRIVVDICSFIPQVNNGWSDITWTVCSGVLLIFNIVAIVFAFLQYKMADGKHKILMVLILIILFFTLATELTWFITDLIDVSGTDTWDMGELIGEIRIITVIAIACDLVAIPTDIISTYLISKDIK